MSIVWIIERAEGTGPNLAGILMGDYAVRVFASLESFAKLAKLGWAQRPSLVLIDWREDSWSAAKLVKTVKSELGCIPIVTVGKPPEHLSEDCPNFHHFAASLDGFQLSKFVGRVLQAPGHAAPRGQIRYRGVCLDYERLLCQFEGQDYVSLAYKEAQLLKFLLERPRICLSRAEIQAAVWPDVKVAPRTVDSHISRLRSKLIGTELRIKCTYGGGYTLV